MRIFLTYPPSLNRLWLPTMAGIKRSPVYRKWMDEAAWTVALAVRDQKKSMRSEYRMRVTANPPPTRRARDLDNLLKATCDALKHGGAVVDDSYAQAIEIHWGWLDGPGVLVELEECRPSLTSPEGGNTSSTSGTERSPTRLRNRPVATIRDAVTGEVLDMAQLGSRVSGSRGSSTSAESTASTKRKRQPKT